MAVISPFAVGLIYIGITVVIWTGAGFATQYLETTLEFNAPFLFTYLSSVLFAVNLPLYYVVSATKGAADATQASKSSSEEGYYQLDIEDSLETTVLTLMPRDATTVSQDNRYMSNDPDDIISSQGVLGWLFSPLPAKSSLSDMIIAATVLAPVLFLGNLFYNYSLMFTSISSSIVIANLNGSFTLLFSYLSGVEEVTSRKVLGVGLCLVGVLLVSQGDRVAEKSGEMDSTAMFGDAISLAGAVCYGLYTTLIKIKIPDGTHQVSTSLLFGLMGVVTMVLGAPILVVLAVTKSGGFNKLTKSTLAFIFCEEMLDSVAANYLYARATILASPSVAAVGESLTIPLSIVAEQGLSMAGSKFAGSAAEVTWWEVGGGALVTCGFLLLSLG